MIGNNFLLWENETFIIKTPFNPHIPYTEGLHIVVSTQDDYETAWDEPTISGEAFEIAAKVSKIVCETGISS